MSEIRQQRIADSMRSGRYNGSRYFVERGRTMGGPPGFHSFGRLYPHGDPEDDSLDTPRSTFSRPGNCECACHDDWMLDEDDEDDE
jgi:hypothetical protein